MKNHDNQDQNKTLNVHNDPDDESQRTAAEWKDSDLDDLSRLMANMSSMSSMSVNLKSAQVYNDNLASFEANFDYLVINATLSTMLTADKVKMVSGLRQTLVSNNKDGIVDPQTTQDVLFNYLRKKGLNKEDARRRSVYLVNTIQAIPMDNGLSFCVHDKSQLSRSNTDRTQSTHHSSRKLPMVDDNNTKKLDPNNQMNDSEFADKKHDDDSEVVEELKLENAVGNEKAKKDEKSPRQKLTNQIDLNSPPESNPTLQPVFSASEFEDEKSAKPSNHQKDATKPRLFSCFCCK